ncbi:MAG: hypothetical protein K2G04_08280, partial [Oscillospiraceae bacterium]|nr:hypothetical protein [Oscillospiraceae bacterium]
YVVIVIIMCAAALAFIVLYNLNNIKIIKPTLISLKIFFIIKNGRLLNVRFCFCGAANVSAAACNAVPAKSLSNIKWYRFLFCCAPQGGG